MVSPQKISSYLRKPNELNAASEAELREIINQHPYFSNAWVLLTRSLRNQDSPKFDTSLKQSSMYAGERALLYKLVNLDESGEKEKPISTTNNFAAVSENKVEPVVAKEPIATTSQEELIEDTKEETFVSDNIEENINEVVGDAENKVEEKIEDLNVTTDGAITASETLTDTVETELGEDSETVSNIANDVEEQVEEKIEAFGEELPTFETLDTDTIETELENNISEEVNEVSAELDNEQEKVKSAYEKILGSEDEKEEESIENNEFETFDINERVDNQEPALPDFDDEDFILNVEGDDNSDLMAAVIIGDETIEDTKTDSVVESEETNISANTEEDFKLEIEESAEGEVAVSAKLDEENVEQQVDAITESAASTSETIEETQEQVKEELTENLTITELGEENSEEIAPLAEQEIITEETEVQESAVTENIEGTVESVENVEGQVKEEVAENITSTGYSVDNEEEIAALPQQETVAELADNANEVLAISDNVVEEIKEEVATVDEAIDFKLNTAEQNTEVRQEESVATPVVEESQNVVLSEASFFGWLTQLNNPETTEPIKKKNDVTEVGAISTAVSESTQAPIYEGENSSGSVPQENPDVDAIIERFIKINPTISRPKAEFYNPEAKSKESDTESDDLATETLAKIYRDQQLNDKAIDVYKRLIAIYPNKAVEYNAIIAEINAEQ